MKEKINSHLQEFQDLHELRHVIISKSHECKRARNKNKDFSVNPSKIENLKAACKALVRADRYNGSILRGMLASEIQDSEDEAIRIYDSMLDMLPKNIKAYFHYFKYLLRIERHDKIEEVTSKMMKEIDDPLIPTDEWMEAHITRAQALVFLNRTNEAIETLEQLIHIIPPLPIPGLSLLQKLERRKRMNPEDEIDNNGAITIGYDNHTLMKTLGVDDFIQGKYCLS